MYVTVTIEIEGNRFDVSADDRQPLCAVVGVLADSGRYQGGPPPAFFKSLLQERPIAASETLQSQGICSGDLLTAV